MVDNLDTLVFSMHASPGAHALLLGSGVSRAAGIPTGWEITLDLAKQLARSRGEETHLDPEAWYRNTFDEALSYSVVLGRLATTPATRQGLLRGYFEPDEAEREEGLKLPTPAHQAIAKLAADGHVRVILTTNFDRLLELALEEAGLAPTVVSTNAEARGALPLVHQNLLVVKLHGDYRNPSILNTDQELERYPRDLRRLLGGIADQFGLVVCGWSGEWDVALREALMAKRTRRFGTFIATRSEPGEHLLALAQQHQGHILKVEDADSFFTTLQERLESLAELNRPHPMSAEIAVQTLKRYLPESRHRIRLHDLVTEERERAYQGITNLGYKLGAPRPDAEEFAVRLKGYEAQIETLEAILATGCYWDREGTWAALWSGCVERLATPESDNQPGSHFVAWKNLQFYPALRLLYVGGLAATAVDSYATLFRLLTSPQGRDGSRPIPALFNLVAPHVFDPSTLLREVLGQNYLVPGSEKLFVDLRRHLAPYVPNEDAYGLLFDRFEYTLAVQYVVTTSTEEGGYRWGPVGRFCHRLPHPGRNGVEPLRAEIEAQGDEHPMVKAGLFGGKAASFKAAEVPVQEAASRVY